MKKTIFALIFIFLSAFAVGMNQTTIVDDDDGPVIENVIDFDEDATDIVVELGTPLPPPLLKSGDVKDTVNYLSLAVHINGQKVFFRKRSTNDNYIIYRSLSENKHYTIYKKSFAGSYGEYNSKPYYWQS